MQVLELKDPPAFLAVSGYHGPLCAGTIGHVAHGKSTVVKAISGVQTVRFKNELERNITIKLGYANAKIYKCKDPRCPRPACYKAYGSSKEDNPKCDVPGEISAVAHAVPMVRMPTRIVLHPSRAESCPAWGHGKVRHCAWTCNVWVCLCVLAYIFQDAGSMGRKKGRWHLHGAVELSALTLLNGIASMLLLWQAVTPPRWRVVWHFSSGNAGDA